MVAATVKVNEMHAVRTRQVLLMLVAAIALSVSGAAVAAIDNVGLLDEVLRAYAAKVATWQAVITRAATFLFWSLVIISMVWTFGMLLLKQADLQEFFREVMRLVVVTGLFWTLLLYGPAIAASIIDGLQELGGQAVGSQTVLTPSTLVDVGFEIFGRTADASSWFSPIDSGVAFLCAIIILAMLAVVAVNLLMLKISAWILIYAGIILLGFGGARLTQDIAVNYIRTVIGIGVQLMVMVLLVGIGKSFLIDYHGEMSQGVSYSEIAVIMVICITLVMLTSKIPPMVAGIVTGAPQGSGIGTSSVASMVAGAATMLAALAVGAGAAKAGASALAGGASAVKEAVKAGSANVASGSDVMSRLGSDSQGRGSESSPGSGGGGGDSGTPLGSAAGFNAPEGSVPDSGDSDSSGSVTNASGSQGAARAGIVARVGRTAIDASANLALGSVDAARGKGREIRQRTSDAIASTTGGRVANAIKERAALSGQPPYTPTERTDSDSNDANDDDPYRNIQSL